MKLKEALSKNIGLIDFCLFGSKVRGNAAPDSDIDDIVFKINLSFDCFISTIIFGRAELEGPLSESPIYKTIEKEGIRI